MTRSQDWQPECNAHARRGARCGLAAGAVLFCTTGACCGDDLFPERRYDAGEFPTAAEMADLNGDGELDVITMNDSSDSFASMFGVGDGTFEPPRLFEVGGTLRVFTVGDLNGDNIPDLAHCGGGSVAYTRLGVGDGTFGEHEYLDLSWSPDVLEIADITGDGHADLVCGGWLLGLVMYVGHGDGTFDEEPTTIASLSSQSITVTDFDADGDLDLVVTSATNGAKAVSVIMNEEDGAFSAPMSNSTGDGPTSSIVADVNADALPDIIILNEFSDDFSVFLGDPEGLVFPELRVPAGFPLRGFDVADADGDGQLDIVCTDGGRHRVVVLRGAGDGSFTEDGFVTTGADPRSVWATDVDGDSHLDLLAFNANTRDLSVHRGSGAGAFEDHPRVPFSFDGARPSAGVCADFDGDGFHDIASAFYDPSGFGVAFGDGGGGFRSVEFHETVATNTLLIATGDVNGDGHADLLITTITPDAAILLGNGDGSFAPETLVSLGVRPADVEIGDLNGDGMDDVVCEEFSGQRVAVSLAVGSGQLAPAQMYDFWNSLNSLSLTDFDGDGDLDPVVACTYHDGTTTWEDAIMPLINRGDGTLDEGAIVLADLYLEAVCVEDLDGDGDADLAVVNLGSDSVSVRYRRDNGTFGPAFQYEVGVRPLQISAADLDDDGHLDLVAVNTLNGGIGVLRGIPTPWFDPEERYAAGGVPALAGIVDADGDGDLDVLTVNNSSMDISVLRNQTVVPPDCIADLDGNGQAEVDDIELFVSLFIGGDAAADIDGSGDLSVDDIELFVAAFLGGCA